MALALYSGAAVSVDVTMQRTDSGAQFSLLDGRNFFTPAGSGSLDPDDDYFSGTFRIRAPDDGNSFTFGGNSLTIETGGTLSMRTIDNAVVTIDDLTLEDGSTVREAGPRSGVTGNPWGVIDGVITLDGGVATLDAFNGAEDRRLTIAADVTGSGGLSVESQDEVGGAVIFSSTDNDYTGDTTITTGGVLRMADENVLPHDPSDGDLIVDDTGTFQLNGNDTTIQGLADGASGGGIVENSDQDGTDAATLTIQGDADAENDSFSGTIRDNDGSAGGTLSITKTGSMTTQTLSGENSYTGETRVEGGTLRVASDTALGNTAGETTVDGGKLEVDGTSGDLTIAEVINLTGQSGTDVQLENVAGANTLSGGVTLTDDDPGDEDNHVISTAGGTLAITTNGLNADLASGTQNVRLGGVSGTSTISATSGPGLDLGGGASYNLIKDGANTWQINGANIQDAPAVKIETLNGTLQLSGNVNLNGLPTEVLIKSGATLAVDNGLTLGDDQSIGGDGTFDGNLTLGGSATIGAGESIGTLAIDGDLDLGDGTLVTEVSGTAIDLITVTGLLDIEQATLDLQVDAITNDPTGWLVLARYGTLTGMGFADITIASGFQLDDIEYAYGTGSNQIAVQISRSPAPVPAPAPLALIGVGLFALAGRRLLRRH